MQNLFKKYDIELEAREQEKFQEFLKLFLEKNTQINLSSIRDEQGVIEKHFIDSLMLAVFFDLSPTSIQEFFGDRSQTITVADLGTGGGFPGIPLAIIYPEITFTLIDSVVKKLRCVGEFAQSLQLENITTLSGRAENIGQDKRYRESFDLVVSRATAYFPTLLEYSLPLLKVGGILAAYKLTDKQEFQSIKNALSKLGGKIYKIKNYHLADQERSIVFIQKIASCHKKYPRKVGIPLKDHL